MIILGINDIPHHNTSAAVVINGKVVSAIEEERISRMKMDNGYPFGAIQAVLDQTGLTPEDIDLIALAGHNNRDQHAATNRLFRIIKEASKSDKELRKFFLEKQFNRYARLLTPRPSPPRHLSRVQSVSYEHHHAHAASAYYTSPFNVDEPVGVITLDGSGDAVSSTVWLAKNGRLEHVLSLPTTSSIGLIYSAFTTFLGFTPGRHEGKVLGLAAFGNPEPMLSRLLEQTNTTNWERLFSPKLVKMTLRFAHRMGLAAVGELASSLSKEDVAAGLQAFTEKVVLAFVQEHLQKLDVNKLALAGGVFANVKLNQRILALPEVENIYIHPNMGDGGLAAGAALQAWADVSSTPRPHFMQTAYQGHDINKASALAALEAAGLIFDEPENMADSVALLLADGKVVARAAGRMEYGPRALGNRTVMAACSDPSINKWLNDKFQRTEFMPFAPVTLEDHAADYYPDWKPEHTAARFMTITYDVSEKGQKEIPAAVHVDNTARPQVIRREDNPDYYDILHAYHAKTGISAVINTSFNMHEEPIVCSADDAIRAWQQAELDALVLGPFLVKRSAKNHQKADKGKA